MFVLLMSCLQSSVVSAADGPNLVPNASFDHVTDGSPTGWEPRAWNDSHDHASWDIDPAGRTGQCVTIRTRGDASADAAWTARVTVRPHTFYRLSGWIKTRGVEGATGALLNIQNMQHVRTQAVTGTSDWTRVSTTFRTADAPLDLEINCLFGGWGVATGQAWYDDVLLEPVDVNESTEAVVTVDTDAEAIPYSPMLFGGFLEHFNRQIYGGVFDPGSPLSDEQGFRTDVLEALKELKVPVVRWPGGCFVSGYHWEDGVGRDRQATDDMAWGVREPNTFGTDEFVELCRVAGWEPFICNNAGNGTVQEMVDWVAYCNETDGPFAEMRKEGGHAEPFNVVLWSVGNENWGGHEIGQKTQEEWGPLVVDAAKRMKAVDPDLQLSAAALPSREWTVPLLEAAGDYLDYISIHQYWLPLWQKHEIPSYLACVALSEGPEDLIANYIAILEETGYRGRIKIAFDEWNLRAWHHPGFPRKSVSDYDDPEVIALVKARDKSLIASQYTMADALFTASFLNACLRHAEDVGMANIAPLVNTRGPLHVHPKGVVKRTHFHTLAMYANLLGARVGACTVDRAGVLFHGDQFVPVVDAVATVNDAGTIWTLALVNRHPSSSVDCTVNLKDTPLSGTFAATVLEGDSPDAFNDIEHPDRVTPEDRQVTFRDGVTALPPHSLTIVDVPGGQ
ncbi:MAG: alpha-N-arabinofuranosidase [bacterium]|nr:alpha-N-arabinofuranosidase [bacterium]